MPDRKAEFRALCQQSRFSEALALGESLCRKQPGDAELWFLMGAVQGALEAFDKAEYCCRKALAIAPDQPVLLYNLGIALLRQQRASEADEFLQRARRAQPGTAEFATAVADSMLQQGRFEAAIEVYEDSLRLAPRQPQALRQLAWAHRKLGQSDAADACYQRALALDPAAPGIYLEWSKSLIERGDLDKARQLVGEGLARIPGDAGLHYQMGYVLAESGRHEQALQSFDACLAADAAHREARLGRAAILRHAGRLTEAAADLQFLIDADAQDARAHAGLTNLLLDEGCPEAAVRHARIAAGLAGDDGEMQEHLLMNLHYAPDVSPRALFEAHCAWGVRFGAAADARTRHANPPDPDRVLRIGYVSADFHQHSVAHFIAPVLANHDRGACRVYCYSNLRTERHDATTAALRASADLWRDVAGLNDRDLADTIAADGIDVLVDLSGHTTGNRLAAFALRPAPIQMTWIGYPDSTGLPAMGHRLTDAWADPAPEADAWATETLLRIPDGFLCYSPPGDAPDCGVAPHVVNGFVTFGSLNNLAKVNDTVVDRWSEILGAVPGSRFVLKGAGLADAAVRARTLDRFACRGVDADRLELIPFTRSVRDHLACYRSIDVALDTFPYGGTTTTCEALWMGVAVVTLAGSVHAARVGLSLLHQLGLERFAATAGDDYVALAVELAGDSALLTELRASLRERMRGSPLMDGRGFCGRLERCYRRAWRDWCGAAG